MTDFRALCAELVDDLELCDWPYKLKDTIRADTERARAALAEPVIPVKQRVFPTPSQAVECGGPCYEGNYCPEACDCGLYQRSALAEQPVAIGPEWQPCVKLPITVHVREQRQGETHTSTREGITPLRHDDLIMRGVQGEEYPIGRELFEQTYRMGTPELEGPTDKELWEAYDQMDGVPDDWPWCRDYARAVLARWGNLAAEPDSSRLHGAY